MCVRESVKNQGKVKSKEVFAGSSWEAFRKVKHVLSTWLEYEESWQMVTVGFCECFAGKAFSWDTHEIFCFTILSYLIHLISWKECFQRENPSHNLWELEIVIPTILYTIHCGFRQILPLHFQILGRLIAQTLTIPILSGKWGFGTTGKHWKKPFVWWMQSGWIAWSGELEKTGLGEVSW